MEAVIPETSDSEASDADRDVTAQETVPYANCVTEGTSAKSDTHFRPHIDGSLTMVKESPQKRDEDDGLELVREIFFT